MVVVPGPSITHRSVLATQFFRSSHMHIRHTDRRGNKARRLGRLSRREKGRKNIGERHGVKGMPIRLVQGRLLCSTEIDSWEWKRRMSSYELRVFDLKLLFLGWKDDSIGTLFEKNYRWFIDCKPLKYFVIKSYIPFISYWTLWNL